MRISFEGEGIALLRKGDNLIYTAGTGEYYVRARVVVVKNGHPGATGIHIHLEHLLDHGGKSSIVESKDGEVIASGTELSNPDADIEFLKMLVSRAREK